MHPKCLSQYQTSQIEVQGTYCPPNECPVMTIWVTSSRTLSVKNWAIFDRVYPGNHITFSETSTTRFGFIPEWTTNYLPNSDAKTQLATIFDTCYSLVFNEYFNNKVQQNTSYQPNSKTKQMSHLAKSICSTRSLAQKHHLAHIFASAPATKTRVQKKNQTFNGLRLFFFWNLPGESFWRGGFRQIRTVRRLVEQTWIRKMKLISVVLSSTGTPSSEIR